MTAYLDHAATTPVLPAAAGAALHAMTMDYANPSSGHAPGTAAALALKEDRAAVAALLGCPPERVFFTSGGTEGDNWAVALAAHEGRHKGGHIITAVTEHTAVLEPIRALEQAGHSVTWLRPDRAGRLSMDDLKNALRPDTVLVSLMLVNNETGVRTPVEEAARVLRAAKSPALLHTDAVQAFCKMPFSVAALGADLVTVSGHKLGAPKGIGALYIRAGLQPRPLLRGGGQEGGFRPGTEPTAQIAALAAACRAWAEHGAAWRLRLQDLKDYALDTLTARVAGLVVVSPGDTPHIFAISLPGYPAEMLVRALSDRGVYLSSASACHRGKPSHVFAALGLEKHVLTGTLRVSLSPATTRDELDLLVRALCEIRAERVSAVR